MIARYLAAALLPALALLPAACKREPASDAAAAAGQILPGSASDAMLPADRVTSQPPLDPGADRGTGKDTDEKGTATQAPAGDKDAAVPAPESTAAAE